MIGFGAKSRQVWLYWAAGGSCVSDMWCVKYACAYVCVCNDILIVYNTYLNCRVNITTCMA